MKELIFSMVAVCSACLGVANQAEIPIQPQPDNQVCIGVNDADELPSGELPPILEKCKKKKRN